MHPLFIVSSKKASHTHKGSYLTIKLFKEISEGYCCNYNALALTYEEFKAIERFDEYDDFQNRYISLISWLRSK